MRKITTTLVSFVLLVGSAGVCAKNISKPPKTLTLNEAIMLAVRNNPEVRSAKLQRVIDKFALEVARNEFEPQYVFTAKGDVVEGKKPVYSASPKVSLKTPIGTQLDVAIQGSYFNGNDTERLTASLKQPLLRGFGTDVTLARWHGALDSEKLAKLALKDKVQSTITAVIKSYYTLVQDYNRLDVDRLALEDSLQSLKSIKMRIKAGNVAPMEATQQEAQVANQRFTLSQDQNTIDRDYQEFLVLLGLDPNSKIQIDRAIPKVSVPIYDLDKSIKLALEKNIGFIKNLISGRGKERELMLAQDAMRWKLDLVASVQKTIRDEQRHDYLDTSQGDFNYDDRRLGLELEIPIDNKPLQQKLVNAKIGLKKFNIALDNERRSLVTKVVNAVRDLKAQREQIESAKRAVELSQQSLHIAQRKFDFGRTSMFELTSLRKSLTSRQQSLINQQIAYLNTVAQYEQTLGLTLDRWHLTLFDK